MTVHELISKLQSLPEQYQNYQVGYITGDEFNTWTENIEDIDLNIFESITDIEQYNTQQSGSFTDYPYDAIQTILLN